MVPRWIAFCLLIFVGGLFLYRLSTVSWSLSERLHTTQWMITNRLLALLYPLDPEWTKAFASLVGLLETQVDKETGTLLLDNILMPLQEKNWPLYALLQKYFPHQAALFHQFSLLRDDLSSLLGMESPQTYLLVLQNTAEKRPNWGFFGSFALVTLSRGKVTEVTMSDSYHPWYNTPSAKLLWPEWLEQFLPERDIYFVWANKVWFTYHDGPHIKTLYEKSYPGKTIRWVVFLRTDMFTKLLPGFEQQLRRRQYVNATVDLIRGEERRWKKELYLWSLEEYLNEHRLTLAQQLWTQLPTILEEQQINIYLDNVSGKMHTLLRRSWLTTRFEENHVYFWDSNIVFNKLDRFIEKNIELLDEQDHVIWSWTWDIVHLPELSSGLIYRFVVAYTLAVPEAYHTFIRSMNEEYNIVLWQREEHILGVHHERATRGNVYFSPMFRILSIEWDISSQRTFSTPFSQNAAYETHIGENNQTNTVRIEVQVNK